MSPASSQEQQLLRDCLAELSTVGQSVLCGVFQWCVMHFHVACQQTTNATHLHRDRLSGHSRCCSVSKVLHISSLSITQMGKTNEFLWPLRKKRELC